MLELISNKNSKMANKTRSWHALKHYRSVVSWTIVCLSVFVGLFFFPIKLISLIHFQVSLVVLGWKASTINTIWLLSGLSAPYKQWGYISFWFELTEKVTLQWFVFFSKRFKLLKHIQNQNWERNRQEIIVFPWGSIVRK